jgi:TetR/AcrR family transcriptional regulator
MPARTPAPRKLPAAPGREGILAAALPLFAAAGFHGVSMREVAAAARVTPAALYYHFPDKEQLYLALIAHVYSDRIPPLIAQMAAGAEPWQRLENLVAGFVRLCVADPQLTRLGQWILLDTDPARSRLLAENVFRPLFAAITQLAQELGGGFDAQRLTASVIGLVMFPFQCAVVTRHLPGFPAPADAGEADALIAHIVKLLRGGVACGWNP